MRSEEKISKVCDYASDSPWTGLLLSIENWEKLNSRHRKGVLKAKYKSTAIKRNKLIETGNLFGGHAQALRNLMNIKIYDVLLLQKEFIDSIILKVTSPSLSFSKASYGRLVSRERGRCFEFVRQSSNSKFVTCPRRWKKCNI